MAKYFSLSVDSTPDLTHVDQLTVIIRYVLNGVPVERFLTFLQMSSHKSEYIATSVLEYLKSQGIDFMDCRGQSYDNASNMAGEYSGMQARLKEVNPKAVFVPCSAHSLNLVGTAAVDSCIEAVSFFGFLQSLYSFFSASTYRWSMLIKHLKEHGKNLTLKSLSDTRWSARADATNALYQGYSDVKAALHEIANDPQQNHSCKHEANSLLKKMNHIEIAYLCCLWNTILIRFNATSKSLQSKTIDLNSCVDLLCSLSGFVNSQRDRFDEFETQAKAQSGTSDYRADMSRVTKRNMRYDCSNQSEEVSLSGREKFRTQTHLCIIDSLITCLNKRIAAYQATYDRFIVIVKSCTLTTEEIHSKCVTLALAYPSDLSASVFPGEMIQFIHFAKGRGCHSPQSQALLLHDEHLEECFPNVYVALRIYLALMVTDASGERSFSKLGQIKNHLRTSMSDDRLTALTILSIESDILKQIDFADIINNFAAAKSRKCFS